MIADLCGGKPCCAGKPCNAEQMVAQAHAGEQLVMAMRTVLADVKLPSMVSSIALSTIRSVTGSVEGIIGQQLSSLQSSAKLSNEQLQLVTAISGKLVINMFKDIQDGNGIAVFEDFARTALEVGTMAAREIAKDAVGVIPIVGAIVSVVIDIVVAIVQALGGKPDTSLRDAAEEEKVRSQQCRDLVASSQTHIGDNSLPCDFFNGSSVGPGNMTATGFGLMCAAEENPLIVPQQRLAIAALRRLIQGRYLGSGPRGMDGVPPRVINTPWVQTSTIPGVSDGGKSLWPIYLDVLLWNRQVGALDDNRVFEEIRRVGGPFGICAPEATYYVTGLIDQWRFKKRELDSGTGYDTVPTIDKAGQKIVGLQKPTAKQALQLQMASAYYAGTQTGVKYKMVQGQGGALALVGPGSKLITFPKSLNIASGKTIQRVILYAGAAAALYYAWKRTH